MYRVSGRICCQGNVERVGLDFKAFRGRVLPSAAPSRPLRRANPKLLLNIEISSDSDFDKERE